MKVLITAFKPFNNQTNNYSLEVLKYIKEVDKIILDVCYDECYKYLKENKNLNNYDLIIAMGEARMRKDLMIEVNAKNISSCSLPDNSGIIKKDEKIINDGYDLKTLVNLDTVKDVVKLSNDAGKFVCNNLYYHLLADYPFKSIFIHIPNCNDNHEEYLKHANLINKIIDLIKRD